MPNVVGVMRNLLWILIDQRDLKYFLKLFLYNLGIWSYTIVKLPIVNNRVRVCFHPSWRSLEQCRFEFECIKYVVATIRPDDVVLDVGAWIGAYTLLFSILVGKKGLVYSFEPDSKALIHLLENVRLNGLSNVYIERCALTNFIGKIRLTSHKLGNSRSSILDYGRAGELKERAFVEVTTIDRYCEENNLVPTGIKIDVEGAEGLVIEGASKVLQKYHPWVLLEFHGFIPEKERNNNWQIIKKHAKEIINLQGPNPYLVSHFLIKY